MATKYVIASSDELYHWKYIKREKKNGKWVYTYDDDPASTTVNVKDTNKLLSSRTSITLGNSRKDVTYNRGKLERAMDKAKEKLGVKKYLDDRETDWYESTNRATEKAVEKAEKKGRTVDNTDKLLSSNSTIKMNGKVLSDRHNRGKIERYAETAKEYIKDRLGYDERDALEIASAKYDYAQKAEKTYQDISSIANSNMGKIDPRDGSITYTEAEKERLNRRAQVNDRLRKETAKAGKEASEAADAYFNTTLGKLEKTRKAGEDWLERMLGRNR